MLGYCGTLNYIFGKKHLLEWSIKEAHGHSVYAKEPNHLSAREGSITTACYSGETFFQWYCEWTIYPIVVANHHELTVRKGLMVQVANTWSRHLISEDLRYCNLKNWPFGEGIIMWDVCDVFRELESTDNAGASVTLPGEIENKLGKLLRLLGVWISAVRILGRLCLIVVAVTCEEHSAWI